MRLFGVVNGEISREDVGCWFIPPFELRAETSPSDVDSGRGYQILVAAVVEFLQREVGDAAGIQICTAAPEEEPAELHVDCGVVTLGDLPRRHMSGRGVTQCVCRVRCWSHSGTKLGLAEELSDQVLNCLERTVLPVRDFRTESLELWGYLRFREGVSKDFSRRWSEELSRRVRCFEVELEGTMEWLERE